MVSDHHRSKIDEFFATIETEAWLAVMARQGGWVGRDPKASERRRLAAFGEGVG